MVDLDYLKMSKPQKFAHNCSRFFASLPGRIGGLFKGLGLWIVGLFKGLGFPSRICSPPSGTATGRPGCPTW